MSEGIQRFYDYAEISAAGDCIRFVKEILRIPIEGDRVRPALTLSREGWNQIKDEAQLARLFERTTRS